MFTSLVLSLISLASCGDRSSTAVMAPLSDATVASRQRLADRPVVTSTLTKWTQVDDGTCGHELEDTVSSIEWIAYHLPDPAFSTPDTSVGDRRATTPSAGDATSARSFSRGIWIGRDEIAQLPTFGPAWRNLRSAADSRCGTPDLSNQNQSTNVCVMAKALVFARTGQARYRGDVVTAVRSLANSGRYSGTALSLGRELGAYVIAADLIDLERHDPILDALFRVKLAALLTTHTFGAADDLIDCHERRPNNWGTHCGATRAAIAVYLDDAQELARTAQVFRGYLGDRAAYVGFKYGGPSGQEDLSWQCDESRPVGINPVGCVKYGLSLDGVLPDDQRRGGSLTTSPPKENYVWEALQGALVQAVILDRAGYPAFEWEDRALLRAVRWLHDVADYPAVGDDTWLPYIVNNYYGTSFPTESPARYGKNAGWTDWTHR